MHDIGYVRGILKGDGADGYVIDAKGNKTKLPRGASDAALLPYHVDRSKLFVMDRIAKMELLDAERIARAIEFTRFPVAARADDEDDNEEGLLVRAADLIGQLGDPHYLRKANALYYEFEEVGMNKQLGYTSPADLTDLYPQFYWNSVSPHIQTAIRYLNVTSSGRQWIANSVQQCVPCRTRSQPVRPAALSASKNDCPVMIVSRASIHPSLRAMGGRRSSDARRSDLREPSMSAHDREHRRGELSDPAVPNPAVPRSL